jgi:hypothetical protein
VERRAHSAGERVRARLRRTQLEGLASGLRRALLTLEEPDAAGDDRWDLRRLTWPE